MTSGLPKCPLKEITVNVDLVITSFIISFYETCLHARTIEHIHIKNKNDECLLTGCGIRQRVFPLSNTCSIRRSLWITIKCVLHQSEKRFIHNMTFLVKSCHLCVWYACNLLSIYQRQMNIGLLKVQHVFVVSLE